MKPSIVNKLWLGMGTMVAILIFSGSVSYVLVQRITQDVIHMVEIREPLEEAVLEMEINVGETAREVLDFVRDAEPAHLTRILDSEADFERFAAEYDALAETAEERALGGQVASLYMEFKQLTDDIVQLAQTRQAA